jgi:16S rRNA (cytosine1402-N4)-methyltransferase
MDMRLGVTAEDMLRVLTEKQLAEAFRELGGEKEAKATARAAKAYVMNHSPVTAKGLAEAITRGKYEKRGKIHPATKVFQALRMMVNLEIDNIKHGLPQAREILEPNGRIVTIAFHEGEDRLAKHLFAAWEKQGKGIRSPKDVVIPSSEEIERNPRSRSAKMRVFIVC